MTDLLARARVIATYTLLVGALVGGGVAFGTGHDGGGWAASGALVVLLLTEAMRWAEGKVQS
jgi:hypothetical protein